MSGARDFLLHLRLNYNFLILSAPFFLGAVYLPFISNLYWFSFSFLIIYVLLFGGANAYNSYFDKDEGPIGGLEHPPVMQKWMYYLAWLIQMLGIILSLVFGPIYSLLFVFSVILFWMYSGPTLRFKGKPILSFVVIGIGTVFNITLLGYLSAGGKGFPMGLVLGAIGVSLIILSMYPFSQAYQIEEDKKRGDATFAIKYGVRGIRRNYATLFLLGVIFLAYSFLPNDLIASIALLVGLVAYISIWQIVKSITGKKEEYRKVMKTKYYGGIVFTFTVLLLLVLF